MTELVAALASATLAGVSLRPTRERVMAGASAILSSLDHRAHRVLLNAMLASDLAVPCHTAIVSRFRLTTARGRRYPYNQ